jgi:hypothetical protein
LKQKTCPSCESIISPKAYDCPKCAHPIRKPKRGFFGVIFKWLLILFNLLMLLWAFSALGVITDIADKPMSDAEATGAAIGTAIGFGLILTVWVFGDIILGLLTLLTRPSK